MKTRRLLTLSLAVLLLIGLLTGCATKDEAAYDSAAPEAGYDDYKEYSDTITNGSSMDYSEDMSVNAPEKPVTFEKKIRRLDLNVETEDLGALLANLETRVAEFGGYIEMKEVYRGSMYADSYYRHAYLTIRVPAPHTDTFVNDVGEISNITTAREDVEDITLQYVATESRVKALTTEQDRLLELLAMAENMEEILLIEQRLTEVRTQLEQVTSTLRVYDNLVDYSTISMNITEVTKYTPTQEQTVWQRMTTGFSKNLAELGKGLLNFFVNIFISLPYLVLVAALLVLFGWVGKKLWKKRKQKKQNKQKGEEQV